MDQVALGRCELEEGTSSRKLAPVGFLVGFLHHRSFCDKVRFNLSKRCSETHLLSIQIRVTHFLSSAHGLGGLSSETGGYH